ncbi:hypothetical protein GCM10007049_13090 [Echinicola pacifica]|uniref:Uncharacterized protein n=1 Tax=Echinicola pacifica TaxID=346377 RepID=A0A918PUI8_9BACT|nr:hypothetical protein GCM10007049_13090 [Echinicola pacifica]
MDDFGFWAMMMSDLQTKNSLKIIIGTDSARPNIKIPPIKYEYGSANRIS